MTVSLIRVRSLTWATVTPARWRASAKAAPIDTCASTTLPPPVPPPRPGGEAITAHHFTRSSRPIACLVLFPASRPASGPPDAHGARSRRCAAIQRSTVASIWHDTVRARGRPTWPPPGRVLCAASRLAPHPVRQRAGRRAGLRHSATLRRSGAAPRPGAGRHHRHDAPSLPPANTRPQPREWTTTRTASATGLLANAATVTRRNGPPGRPGGDQTAKVTGPMRRGFAQVTG